MKTVKDVLMNRLVLMVLTTLATTAGTVLATEYPSVFNAVCVQT